MRTRAGSSEAGGSSVAAGDSSRRALGLLGVALGAALAYATSLLGGFVWDDRTLILEGALPGLWRRPYEVFFRDFFHRPEFDIGYGYFRPLTTLSYALDYALWGYRPAGYHLTNVALHALDSALVGTILLRLGFGTGTSLLAALLFAVHPIHTENVAWISGRTDLLAFTFGGLAILCASNAAEARPGVDASANAWLRRAWSSASVAAFALALLAKETAVVSLAWLVAVGVYRGWDRRRMSGILLPQAVALGAYGAWRVAAVGTFPVDSTGSDLARVLLSAPRTLLGYLQRLVLPLDQSAYIQNPYVGTVDLRFAAEALALVLLMAVLAAAARRSRQVALLGGMLLLALLPLLNLVRIAAPPDMGNPMAERLCYFPSVPFLGLVAVAISTARRHFAPQPLRRHLISIGTAGLLVVLFSLTVARIAVWADEESFLVETLRQSPRSALLWGRLAQQRLSVGDLGAAGEAIDTGLALDPGNLALLSARARWLAQQGRAAEAIEVQEEIVRRSEGGKAAAMNNLAYLYRISGRAQEARSILETLIAEGKGFADVHANLAALYRSEGRLELAREEFLLALSARPADRPIGEAYASLELDAKRPEVAKRVYVELLEDHPGDPVLLRGVALASSRLGDEEGAIRILSQLARDRPDLLEARLEYARALHASGRKDAAFSELLEVERLARGTPLEGHAARQLAAWRFATSPGQGLGDQRR
jgi:tetratricopeptide (TPR) repeat protein